MRLRKGSAGSGRGAASLLAEALVTARAVGARGAVLVRADSKLCRSRHNLDYAEVLVMPSWLVKPLVMAVHGIVGSA
jgi:hypothetical protein